MASKLEQATEFSKTLANIPVGTIYALSITVIVGLLIFLGYRIILKIQTEKARKEENDRIISELKEYIKTMAHPCQSHEEKRNREEVKRIIKEIHIKIDQDLQKNRKIAVYLIEFLIY